MPNITSLARVTPRRQRQLMLAVGLVTCVVHVWLYRQLQHDDAYISFRYARNIASGHGFVFNHGDPTLGTTSPLFTLLMTVPHALGLDVRMTALITSAISLRVAGAALFVILRRNHFFLGVAAFLFTCMGGFGMLGMSLLETFFVAAAAMASVAAFEERRPVLAGVLVGVAFVARYDAFLIVLCLAGASWLRNQRIPWAMLGAALATVLPWLIFATLYFGSPMPRTLAAKAGLTPFAEYLAHYVELIYALPGIAVPWPIGLSLSFFGLSIFVRKQSLGAIVVVLYGVLHLLVYAAIGPPKVQHWHNFIPSLALRFALLAGLAGWASLTSQAARFERVTAAIAGLLTVWVGVHSGRTAQAVVDSFWFGERHRQYVAVAAYLEKHVPREGRFMSTEVGTLGYLTDRSMLDVFGLVTPTNAFPRTQAFVDLIDLVDRYRPEVLLMDNPDQGKLLAGATEYELVHVFPWQQPWSTLLVRRTPAINGRSRRPADR